MAKVPCPVCGKGFKSPEGVLAHARAKHVKHYVSPDLKPILRRDLRDEPSMADRMIDAQLQQAMGGPVDDDWLLDSI